MAVKFTNNAATTLAAGINSSVTSISVTDGSVFPALTGSDHFYVTFDDTTNREIVKVTARSGNTLTVVRGQDNTTAQAFNSGDKAELRVVAALLEDVKTDVSSTLTVDTFTGDGSTTAFTLSVAPASEDNLIVFIEGVYQNPGDFTLSGTTLTLDVAPANSRKIIVYHVAALVSGNNLTHNQFTCNGSTTAFTLGLSPIHENNTQVFLDGVYQQKTDYAVSGTTLTMDTAPANGAILEVMTFTQTEVNTLPASFVSGLTEVTAVGADHFMIFDATDSALKKSLVSDVLESATSISTSADATAITIDSSENVTFTNNVTINSGQLTAGGLAYPTSDGSAGQYLQTDGSGTLSFATVSGTTINNNADNRIITGSATANTLNGESGLTYDGSTLAVTGDANFDSNTLFVDASANAVGIGTNNPSGKLSVTSDALNSQFSAAIGTSYFYQRFSSDGGNHYLGVSNSAGAGLLSGAGAYSLCMLTESARNLAFGTNNTTRMIIDSSGNVGIGKTPDRSRKLEVAGTMNLDDGSEYEWGDGSTSIGGNSSTDVITFATTSAVRMKIIGSGGAQFFTAVRSNAKKAEIHNGEGLYVYNNGGGNPVDYGTGAEIRLADLSHGVNATHFIALSGSLPGYSAGQYNCLKTDLSDLHFAAGGVYTGYIGANTGFTDISDEREKENITTITNATEKLKQLRGVYHTWKDTENKGTDTHIGLIAQEVEAVVPEVVSTSNPTSLNTPESDTAGLKGVAYAKLVPLLIETIKELESRITELENA